MNEIKFRVWCKNKSEWETDKMYLSQQGALLHGDSMCGVKKETHVISLYTGLKDKHGKEIFSGDIVVKNEYNWFDDGVPNYRGTVEWIYSQWQVVAHCVNPSKRGISDGINEVLNDDGIDDGEISEWEIIGNIWENKELTEPPK